MGILCNYATHQLALLRAVYVVFFGQSCYSTRRKGETTGGDTPLQLVRAGLSPETQWAFLQLGFPGGCMMAADASSFDVTTAMAGALGEPVRVLHGHEAP